ncbi:metallo-beta-lactamase superfamily protein [Pedobacter sp. BAL39]|uniref:MBL fold metallo-hydrolase RNA specificity domain-containing protein n=1 Tax=Pedobacter sp. BAL39 TaxID=391596 RepID=UPI00015594AA|nr:MBL fold metallo-hydrolase [Pedobacter sp. BAL39]EDM38216.1 metallo-beta-lactamase superfamily protein [Pedobacter sp. BAL39]
MKLTIWGAARQVTGSMHLLQLKDYNILIDCGLDYEKETYQEENQYFPFDPADLDVVILTHAHIDHSGNLPTLVRMGFQGQILCTPPTADLSELLLLDSVNIFLSKQQKRSKGKNRSSGPKPLYLQKHVMDTVERFVTVGFHKQFRINDQVTLCFIPVGHLLGAAAIVLTINDEGREKKIAFTGDIGRKNYPVLVDPEVIPEVDFLVCESTYGGKFHSKLETLEQKLVQTINEACVKFPGRLIIPAFSIGRTQALVYALNQIFSKGLLPPVKIFVDSPLAEFATDVYRRHHDLLNEDAKAFYRSKGDEFDFDELSYVQDKKESMSVSNYHEPCIIISSAGMLEGGRIQDHLYYNIQNYYCTILFIGYCAKGTLGHRLLRGDPIIRLRNRDLMVYATIQQTDLLSGHGDHEDLMNTVQQQKVENTRIFLVHGEPKSMQSLSDALTEARYRVDVPEKGEVFEL